MKIDSIFGDHLVIQRDLPVPVWGTGEPGEYVTVRFAAQAKTTITGPDGNWSVTLDPLEADTAPAELIVQGDERYVFTDVLVGDVWLCSGQSNMELTFGDIPELQAIFPQAENPCVRVFRVPQLFPEQEMAEIIAAEGSTPSWEAVTRQNSSLASIVAYSFGTTYQKKAGVPVGLILASKGDTPINAWLSEIARRNVPKNYERSDAPDLVHRQPGNCYNGMIAPLIRFPIRGVVWYQGENNIGTPEIYQRELEVLMSSLREAWRAPLHFVIAELSSYGKHDAWDKTKRGYAWVREAQRRAARSSPPARAVPTHDLGEFDDIHPRNKLPVGHRLAAAALELAGICQPALSPRLEKTETEPGALILSFTAPINILTVRMNKQKGFSPGTDPDGFVSTELEPAGFEVCGEEGEFFPAAATLLSPTRIVLCASDVPVPKYVRYAWTNFTLGNLFDLQGNPLPGFRTDDFAA